MEGISFPEQPLASGEDDDVTISGTITYVGSVDNVITAVKISKADGSDSTSNYEITQVNGKLTVTKKANEIQIIAANDSKEYDGTALTNAGYTYTENVLVEGDVLTATVEGSQTNAGESANTVTSYKVMRGEMDVTDQYTFADSVAGKLEVTPKAVTIKTESAEKVYDGEELTAEGTITGILEGEREQVTFTVTGSRTEVGESDNTYTLEWGTVRADNYTVSEEIGKLTVTAQTIVPPTDPEEEDPEYKGVEIDSPADVTYDGAEHQWVPTVTDKDGNPLVAGTDYEVSYTTEKNNYTDVQTITVIITGKGNYKGEVTKTYKIEPRKIKITAGSASKTYDGTALTKNSYEVTSGSVATTDEITSVTVTGSITEVGTKDNVPSAAVIKRGEVDATGNYDITYKEGTLEITAQKINPGPDPENPDPEYGGVEINNPDDVTYDGEEHKFVPEVTDKDGNPLVEGTDYEVTYDVDNFTDVTTVTVTITGKGNYQGEVTKTYEIKQRKIEITAGSASKTYDGTALTRNSYDVTSGSVATTDEITSVTVTGSITEVGTKDNVPSAAVIKRGEVDATGNYDITYKEGTLEITAQKINPGPDPENPDPEYGGVEINNPDDVTYDGEEHKFVPEVTDKDGNPLVEGKDYTVTYDTDNFTDVTKVTVTIIGKDNYDGQVIKTYEIKPAKVTITTDSASKVFDGTALTADGRIEGLVSGEEVTFAVTGSQTAAGSSDNTYTLAWDKTAKEGNYVIDKVDLGTLTVTAQSINPDDPNYPGDDKGVKINEPTDVTYDGDEHKFVPVITDKDGNPLEEGKDYIVTYDKDDFTNVTGQIKVTITGTGDYDGTVVITYQITPKALTVTTDSASKVYDGTALTAGGRIEGLVNGEEVTFKATGSQTSVGSSANTYSLVWDKTAKEGNYTIDKEDLGTLTVTQAPAPEPETPSQDGGNTNTRDHTAPRTGDDTMNTVLFLLLIMILAGAGFGTAAYAYKKRK